MPKVRVLLADDHSVVREGLRNALLALPDIEIAGEVGNGPELLAALNRVKPNLLVLDASMPNFEPVSAVQDVKARHPNLKILIVSAYDDEAYVVGLLKAGVDGYHMKDQPLTDLQLAVERILKGDRWISGSLVDRLTSRRPLLRTPSLPLLTRRQRELLRLLIQGTDNRNIALTLGLSVKTVENHLTALYRALGVDSRLKALSFTLSHPEVFAASGREMVESSPAEISQEPIVLLVDDNARYRYQLSRLIGKVCPTASIYEAENVDDALKLGGKILPQLALIDIVLEEEDGIQCARRLRIISPLTRMVLISAYPDREFRRQALSAGAIAFLDKKDLDTASIRQVVEDALR